MVKSLSRLSSSKLPKFQLFGGLLFSALFPYLLGLFGFTARTSFILHTQTFAVVICAVILGFLLYRGMSTYPGVERTSHILSSFFISFGLAAMMMILFRANYARFMLFSGFILSIGWFYFTSLSSSRLSRVSVGVTPFCDERLLVDVAGIGWVKINDPNQLPAGIDAVAVDLRADIPIEWERALADFALRDIPVFHIKHLKESLTGQVTLEHISENTFGSLSPISAYMNVKHVFDRIVSLVALIVLIFPMCIVGFAIRLDSPGPAIFRQARIGHRGVPFTVYKFRTMAESSCSSENDLRDAMTQLQDKRVTRLGLFLRRMRIDELPQLVNVLLGQMSLVGPRPEAEVLSRWYREEIPFYRYRHIVRPGITGWAQVNQGHVSEIYDVKIKLNCDFYYIKHFSPWLDMLILSKTLRTIISGFGAK